jgi:hypothetical protein
MSGANQSGEAGCYIALSTAVVFFKTYNQCSNRLKYTAIHGYYIVVQSLIASQVAVVDLCHGNVSLLKVILLERSSVSIRGSLK